MTAYKITHDLISAVKLSLQCLELIDAKQASLEQTQPVFRLFEFGDKAKHPYADLKISAMLAHEQLVRLSKGVAGWSINGKDVAFELDVIKARHLVDGDGEDIDVVDALRSLKNRNVKAEVAADNMEQVFRHATALWSNSSKAAVRSNIAKNLGSMKVETCIEKPEIELQSHCKRLVAAVKKLNKDLRDVVRIDNTIMNCYSKRQVMNGLCGNSANTALAILMK